jgi:Tfp pilus assembly protein PilO
VGDSYISAKTGRSLAKLVIACFLVMLVVVVWVGYVNYQGRQNLVTAQRAGCERAKLDREANAQGWRAAEAARLESLAQDLDISYATAQTLVEQDPKSNDPPDLVAARKYNKIASGQEKRSKIDCAQAFPDASLIP